MAKKQKRRIRAEKGKINAKVIFGAVAVLVALPFAINSALQQTSVRQQAAFPSIVDEKYTNLNTASDIVSTINKDGTMGPQTAAENWSSNLPVNLKGSLSFSLTGTDYGAKPSISPSTGYDKSYDTNSNKGKGNSANSQGKNGKKDYANNTQPTGSYGVTTYPSQAKRNYGPQEITALNLTITKVEVHLANFVSPGDKKNSKQQNGYGRSSDIPYQKNQTNDHWETLNVTNPTTIDILQKDAASQLGLTSLSAGRYTQVRLYLSKATATLVDGTTVDLQLLNKDNVIKVVKPFTIEAGKTTYLTMDIDAKHSIVKANDIYILKPVIGKMVEGQAGTY